MMDLGSMFQHLSNLLPIIVKESNGFLKPLVLDTINKG